MSSNVHKCMPVNYSLIKKDFQTYVEMFDKAILFCFRLLYLLKTCHQVHLEKQQLGTDLACTFIERCLFNEDIQFHVSFPSRTE